MSTIFFSWQSDRPNKLNRTFIEKCLKEALQEISSDLEVKPADRGLEFDRDTAGVPGTPDITKTIFEKIDEARIYVADVTFTSDRGSGKLSPNPNVMIEFGRATKSLGASNIILVMNTAFGAPNEVSLPFNIRHSRWPIDYCLLEASTKAERDKEHALLKRTLVGAIKDVLAKGEMTEKLRSRKPFVPYDLDAHRYRWQHEPIGVPADLFSIGKAPVSLSLKPAVWLRLMPIFEQTTKILTTDISKIVLAGGSKLIIDWHPSSIRDYDGYGVYARLQDTPDVTEMVFFCTRTGELWSVDTFIVNACAHDSSIPPIEQDLIRCLSEMHAFSTRLGVGGPFKWIAGIEGIMGRRIRDSGGALGAFRGGSAPSRQDTVIATGDYDDVAGARYSLEPFFRELWDACNLSRPVL